MQATVRHFCADDRTGSVLLDDGHELTFDADAFGRSGLRLLRLGQRVRLHLDAADRVDFLTVSTLPRQPLEP